ncbi:MAG: hypothetical protein Q6353_015415 [Candidatus Sigynarchaeum springense]
MCDTQASLAQHPDRVRAVEQHVAVWTWWNDVFMTFFMNLRDQ